MRNFLLIIAIVLFLQGFLIAAESEKDDGAAINTPHYGLNVSLYSVNSKAPDFIKIVQDIRDGSQGSSDFQLVYQNCKANASPFYYKNEGSYPGSISDNVSPDFKMEELEIRENFIVRWQGKILVPEGYFALKLKDIDDWASVYIYKDQGPDEEKLSRTVPFVTTDSMFGRLVTYASNYTYIPNQELLDIEIIFVQKAKKLSFDIEALMGMTHKAVQVTWGRKIDWLERVYFEEQFVAKNGKWWKPLSEYAESLFSPSQSYEDYLIFKEMVKAGAEPEEEQSQDCESCEEPVIQKTGFKGEFVKISDIQFPIQLERQMIEAEHRGEGDLKNEPVGDPIWNKPRVYTPLGNSARYWQIDCIECRYENYFPDIINYAEDLLINADQNVPLVRTTFQSSEDPNKLVDYVQQAIKSGNTTLDFNISQDNYANATTNLPIYRFFRKAFDLFDDSFSYSTSQASESNASEKTKEEKQGENIVKNVYKRLIPDAQMPDSSAAAAVRLIKALTRNDHFKAYIGPNLFWMGFTKFTGKMRLPSGSLRVKIDRGAKHAAAVLVTDKPQSQFKFQDLDQLLRESVVYSFANMTAPFKAEGAFSGEKGSVAYVYVYFFHFAGPLKLKIQFDPDGNGYRDLSELGKYIEK
jgi:hypothetical protein